MLMKTTKNGATDSYASQKKAENSIQSFFSFYKIIKWHYSVCDVFDNGTRTNEDSKIMAK